MQSYPEIILPMVYGQVKVELSHHNREGGGFVSSKPLAFLLDDTSPQEDSKKKKRKLQITTKNFGAFVSISAVKNAEHLALAWRVRLVWGCSLSMLLTIMTVKYETFFVYTHGFLNRSKNKRPRLDCSNGQGVKVITPIRPTMILNNMLDVNGETVCLV